MTKKVDESSTLAPDGDDVEAVCYLCLDGGLDDADQPLRRDCACRGTDAGYVHLSCLTDFAETKSMQAHGMQEFIKPWEVCPSCHQKYQNDLAIDIATKFVSFVRKQYPDDTRMQVEALYLKQCAFDSILERLKPVQKREAGEIANVLLSLIDRMKAEVSSPLPKRYSLMEAFAFKNHGRIALEEGKEESARRAVVHFENQLEVCEAIGDAEGIACAKSNIAFAKSKYEGGNNEEEVLKASKELYEMQVAEYGEDHEYTIHAGMRYANNLRKANPEREVRELLTKLLAMSKQVLGPHHNTTKAVYNAIIWINFITFIKSSAFVSLLIGVLAMLYQLVKSCHSGSLEQ
jgi:hypothetical protein